MSDYEMNTALARWHGWVGAYPKGLLLPYTWVSTITHERVNHLPDYCNDLNAVRLLRENLTAEQRKAYSSELLNIVEPQMQGSGFGSGSDGTAWLETDAFFPLIHATARQHCEALCRCLGLEVTA